MAFRALLAVLWLFLVAYTAVVIAEYGMTLVPVFFGDIVRLNWRGQFNLDFTFLLVLSALWTAWRYKFAAQGLLLSPVALFGGSGFLLPYIVFLLFQERGDLRRVLLGAHSPAGDAG
jgi:hypothetical protein